MDTIFEFLKVHYQYVFIVLGVLYALAAFFNIGSINQYSTADSGKFFKRFIFEHWGEVGYKVLNMILGIVLAICGILFLALSR